MERVAQHRKKLQKELGRIVELVKQRYTPERIILFGSLARGGAGEGSDIDLVVVKRTQKRFVERSLDLVRLTRPMVSVDFVVYTPEEFDRFAADPASFQQRVILKTGKVLYDVRKRSRVAPAR